ncbi:hypothetical protein GPL15_04015 [Clostridium sp. MCC353]|uniref:hypothetical protein n=1 Tax=Clostridium sp. MCC353 TaxID=2592646 RepID=UPI001C033A82|nr:hypothetical protein [Clostridium sp. MCC353]MBT9775678.1 hypothetical protein [Clostridium sp. MCC353]
MSKNNELKKAYRDLQIQEAPDLWNRIEANLTSKDVPEEDKPVIIHAEEKKKKKKRTNYRAEAGLAAAACCALLVFGGMAGRRQKGFEMAGTMETTMAAMETTAGLAMETTADTAMDGPRDTIRTETGPMAPEAEGAEASTQPGDSSGEEKNQVSQYGNTPRPVSYDSLALKGTPSPLPPENAVYVPGNNYYFTEADLKNAGFLGQVTVENVSYENGSDGRAVSVVYDVVVDKVLYSEDYVSEKQSLQVKSPLVGNGEDNSLLYSLKAGGIYILPLKYENSAYWLLYPNSPQIEVTEDTRYVFHTGWQSLVNDQTAVVLKQAESPEDYYYDRMVMREDPVFLSNLTVLVEAAHRPGNTG